MPWTQFENVPQDCSRPEGIHAAAGHRDLTRSTMNPLSSFGSLPECHPTSPRGAISRTRPPRSFRGFPPLQRFRSVAEPHTPGWFPTIPVTLRPQGFTPSRRFAPRGASRAYSIPVPLLGFTLRGFSPPTVPYALSDAESLMGFRRILRISAAPPGVFHTADSTPAGPGFNRVPCVDCLLGILPSEVSRLRS